MSGFQEINFADAISITEYPNKPLTAYYIGHREVETNLGVSTLHEFEKEDGKRLAIWGFTVLNLKLDMIDKGTLVRLTYSGKEMRKTKYGNKEVHTVKVEADNSKSIADKLKKEEPVPSVDVAGKKEKDDLPW